MRYALQTGHCVSGVRKRRELHDACRVWAQHALVRGLSEVQIRGLRDFWLADTNHVRSADDRFHLFELQIVCVSAGLYVVEVAEVGFGTQDWREEK